MSHLRGFIGSLQYATTNTRADMAAKFGEIQVQLSKPTVLTLLEANKVLRQPQQTCDVSIFFKSIDPNQLTHVAFGDASFASPKQLSCFQGTLVFATTPQLSQLHQNQTAPISSAIDFVCRSFQHVERWPDELVPTLEFHWRNPPEAFRHMHAAVVVTDCKSLCDLVSRRAMPSCAEYRTTLEVLLIKERCLEHCNFGWIPTALRLADPLTKNMDATLLRAVLGQGSFQLFNEDANFQMNAHKKQAIQWIRESHQKKILGSVNREFPVPWCDSSMNSAWVLTVGPLGSGRGGRDVVRCRISGGALSSGSKPSCTFPGVGHLSISSWLTGSSLHSGLTGIIQLLLLTGSDSFVVYPPLPIHTYVYNVYIHIATKKEMMEKWNPNLKQW